MSEAAPIRVMLVDDNEMVRYGLRLFMETFDDLEIAGQAADGEEAVRLCAQLRPDVILMDLVMPVMDGLAATRTIRQCQPQIQVVILTNTKDAAKLEATRQAGAVTCLQKDVSIVELAQAIRRAHAVG